MRRVHNTITDIRMRHPCIHMRTMMPKYVQNKDGVKVKTAVFAAVGTVLGSVLGSVLVSVIISNPVQSTTPGSY